MKKSSMTKAQALESIPPHLHSQAEAFAAKGMDWTKVVALLQLAAPLLEALFKLFTEKEPQPMQAAGDFKCPAGAEEALKKQQESLLSSLADNVCALHCLGCEPHDH